MLTLYQEIALLLLATAILGLLALRLRQPLIRALRRLGYDRHIVVTARTRHDHAELLAAGADDVLTPYSDAADHAARRIAGHLQPRSDTVTSPQEARP